MVAAPPPVVIVVSGPTASGKSQLGIRLARALGGEILSVDSVQVYRGATIGSAKLSLQAREGVPHHLIDFQDPTEQCNAGRFREQALRAVSEVSSRGRVPVLVGGSTMYITALFHGLAPVPAGSSEVRQRLSERSTESLYEQLREVDPAGAKKLHPNDRVRIVRSLEGSLLLGRPMSEELGVHAHSGRWLTGLMVVLVPDRQILRKKIEKRTSEMVAAGLMEETKQLIQAAGMDGPAMRCLGYAQVTQVLRGELPASELEAEISLRTSQYAKRQMTYWRNEPIKRGWACEPSPVRSGATSRVDPAMMQIGELIQRVKARMEKTFERPEVWYVRLDE